MDPVKYSVELRDSSGRLIKILNKIIRTMSWEYDRIGGCGRCSMTAAALYDSFDPIGPDYDLQIWMEDESGVARLFYRGYLESHEPVLQDGDQINLSFFGYSGQLKRVRVQNSYSGQEVSEVVKDILDNYVLPNTDITYSVEDIEASTFTIDTLEFDALADTALKTLAELAGTYEWGINRERKFFFKKPSNDIRHYLRISKDTSQFSSLDDYSLIYNRIYLKGGKVADVTFEDQIDNAESQTSYGLRSKIINNSAIVTSAVSQQYGTAVLANDARIQRRVSLSVPKNLKLYEDVLPLGALSVLSMPLPVAKKYNDEDAIYGSFKYGGLPSFQIEKLRYEIQDEGTKLTIEGGAARPNIYLNLKKLQYEIDQIRGA